ncbi:MAG: PQQ-binding-like beta-propeller repeat protein [Bryobacterales bacterium]|nr:PQQ-binding-like beta-propeller repeat protein [Bryobacterales bacterium]
MTRRTLLALPSLPAFAQGPPPNWTQWGGTHRNFTVPAVSIKQSWAPSGPRILWKRPLGEGFSAISVAHPLAYTLYGRPGQETAIAVETATGSTKWEDTTPVSFTSAYAEMGSGPFAAPLLISGRLITAGATGRLQCLDMLSGKLFWTQQLWSDHKATRLDYGYASSPIAFRDSVIVPAGGPGKALMAFHVSDGRLLWSRNNLPNAYSSPILINLDGLEQLVMLMDGALLAVKPHNGDPQWSVPFKADFGIAVATPVWSPQDRLLFISAEYGAGAKVIQLTRDGLRTRAKELWASNRLRLHHGNAIRTGSAYYFTSGGKGSQAILTAVEAATGKILWQERSIEKATFLAAGDTLVTLDQDGNLMLAQPSPQGFKILAKAQILNGLSWTPPTLSGTRLYLRNRREMAAVELG